MSDRHTVISADRHASAKPEQFVEEADARQFLAGSAARIYGFDLARLDPIAPKVGPTVEELFAA